ncbi:MAG: hypothetical protein GY749_25825 [Desulfobacteraceae bacterium]|nr:hypothetical protein [Desulfobacteraceae bacterium]
MDKIESVCICIEKLNSGVSRNDIIEFLHDSGLTIIESMKLVMSLYNISLGEAKFIVARHPVWENVVKAAEPLHEELCDSFETEDVSE